LDVFKLLDNRFDWYVKTRVLTDKDEYLAGYACIGDPAFLDFVDAGNFSFDVQVLLEFFMSVKIRTSYDVEFFRRFIRVALWVEKVLNSPFCDIISEQLMVGAPKKKKKIVFYDLFSLGDFYGQVLAFGDIKYFDGLVSLFGEDVLKHLKIFDIIRDNLQYLENEGFLLDQVRLSDSLIVFGKLVDLCSRVIPLGDLKASIDASLFAEGNIYPIYVQKAVVSLMSQRGT